MGKIISRLVVDGLNWGSKVMTWWRVRQARGHLAADVDPLGITTANLPELGMRAPGSELIMRKYFNFGTQDMRVIVDYLEAITYVNDRVVI